MQKQYCNKFNKDFKNGPHQKKKESKPRKESMPVGRQGNSQCGSPKNPRHADMIICYFACQIPRRIFVIS